MLNLDNNIINFFEQYKLLFKLFGICLLQPLCIIVPSKDDVAAFADYKEAEAAPSAAAATPAASAPTPAPSVAQAAPSQPAMAAVGGKTPATPFAKKLAAERGIDISVRTECFKFYLL